MSFEFSSFWSTQLLDWGRNLFLALLIFIVGRYAIKAVMKLVSITLGSISSLDTMIRNFIESVLKAFLFLLLIVATLNQLGMDTTSLVALIGAAGLAIGLALKDSLQNLASGVMILWLKPFEQGHFVEAGGTQGTVEKITLFSTQMKSGDNKIILVPNGDIMNDVIVNYSARDTRRVDMIFGIGYDDDIKKAKDILQRIVDEDERILAEPAPVIALGELGASSVDFIVRPWVKSGDYWKVKWEMNEKVKQAFDDAGISIPYPQMDLHLHSENRNV